MRLCEGRQTLLLTAPVLISATVLGYEDITWKQQVYSKFQWHNSSVFGCFLPFFFFTIELALLKLIASDSRSSVISRKS